MLNGTRAYQRSSHVTGREGDARGLTIVEMRRAEAVRVLSALMRSTRIICSACVLCQGSRAWVSEPGEYHSAFTGELQGMWRRLGRPPQMLTGVGFTAQGFDCSIPYTRSKGAHQKPFSACILRTIVHSKVTRTASPEIRVRLHCGLTAMDSPKASHGLFDQRAPIPGLHLFLRALTWLLGKSLETMVWYLGELETCTHSS